MCVITNTPGSTEGPSLHLLDSVWANMSVTRNRIRCFIMAISCSISCSLRLEQRLIRQHCQWNSWSRGLSCWSRDRAETAEEHSLEEQLNVLLESNWTHKKDEQLISWSWRPKQRSCKTEDRCFNDHRQASSLSLDIIHSTDISVISGVYSRCFSFIFIIWNIISINSTFHIVQSTCVHHAEFIGILIKYIKHMKLIYSTAKE